MMPHTYLNLWFYLVFGTRDRAPLIEEAWRSRLHAYLGGTVRGLGGTALEVNGIADHIHLLVNLGSGHRMDYFIRDLKAESSGWVHKEGLSAGFAWQLGYGASTVSQSQVERVRQYIANQEAHHQRPSFEDEFKAMLRAHNVAFDEKYLWS